MTAHVCCNGCDATFKLATFGPESWRAETLDSDEHFFTLRYQDS